MIVRERIAELIRQALEEAQASDALPQVDVEDIAVERPQNAEHGDFATSLPLKLARPMRMNPMQIAERIAERLQDDDNAHGLLSSAVVARPGFINFALNRSWLQAQVEAIRAAGAEFGNVEAGKGQRVQVEFVSANPVGPLHIAHARGGVLGSALANILQAAGCNVTREYYFNDAGAQIGHFRSTLYARYFNVHVQEGCRKSHDCINGINFVPGGYYGEYMIDLAAEIYSKEGKKFLGDSHPALPENDNELVVELGELGITKMMERIREDLIGIRIEFDEWFNEKTLFVNGQYDRSMTLLREKGYVTEREGAVWLHLRCSATTRTKCWSEVTATRPTSHPMSPTTTTSSSSATSSA